ncbi:MAG TPA: phenylalanine--tRNA ligase beta subunit-related protein [Vicinamibacterales bacterium]
MQFTLSPDLQPIVAPALLLFEGVTVLERDGRMDGPIAETVAQLRATPPSETAIARTRTLYRRIGVDPTKTRPSSEALLRRIRKGEDLPRVNSLVDVCNWCSVETQIPYGLYDVDRIEGDAITLRLGLEGEGYPGIRKDHVNVAGRLTLVDAAGPFGNPTSDSLRTSVTTATKRALFVLYASREVEERVRRAAVDLTARRATEFSGGVERWRLLA